ncbi:unnamed protein product [Rotaria socialis]|uniref:Uncharacterized protein n=1 Tax=Rotaria socialis TaxID=392032 RepID=A0A818AV92_9BILA|nr:unnamed protein product [Rotaria socialis]CAF4754939.1 unnamed protein product [Rotaria socialis]
MAPANVIEEKAENITEANTFRTILIQVDKSKEARIRLTDSSTAWDVRAKLISMRIKQSSMSNFLDNKGYRVLQSDEQSISISELIFSTDDGDTIHLISEKSLLKKFLQRIAEILIYSVTIIMIVYFIYHYRKTIMRDYLCPYLDKSNRALAHTLNCSIEINEQDTREYLKNKIIIHSKGEESFVTKDKDAEKLESSNTVQHYETTMYDEWIKNEENYKADYEWYNNMKSSSGNCQQSFEEKVSHSNKLIKDTPESIDEYVQSEFYDWPEKIKGKIKIKKSIGRISKR